MIFRPRPAMQVMEVPKDKSLNIYKNGYVAWKTPAIIFTRLR